MKSNTLGLPKYLAEVDITEVDREFLEPYLSGWVRLCEYLNTENPPEEWVVKLLRMEIEEPSPRFNIITRLHSRLIKLRRSRELKTIQEYINGR